MVAHFCQPLTATVNSGDKAINKRGTDNQEKEN